MALTRDFREAIQARALKDPGFRVGLFKDSKVISTSRLFDLPSNFQVFGHLLYSAGIEGIIYNSKLTGKKCIAIFPKNFTNTDSFIALDDEPPHPDVPTRIDASNWMLTELDYDDATKLKDR